MNKIFKVIWSKTKGCYVVVSEIAKNQSKSGKRRARDLALAAIVGVGVAASNGVSAAPIDSTDQSWIQLNQNVSNMQNQILTLNNWKDSVTQNGGISGGTGTDLSEYATIKYVDDSIAALTAEDGAITAAQAAATTADGKAVAAQTTANEAKTAAATADGKAVAAQNKANQNADAITALQNNKADKTALAEVKATADAAATKTELQAEVTRAQGAEAQALADAKTYTDGKLGAAAGGMYISATNTVAQNMTAIDTKLQDVQKITYDGSYADSEGGFAGGATKVNGPVVIDGTHDFTFNTETGRIKGLSNTTWTTSAEMAGSDVAATQGQLYDIASKGFQVTANNGNFNAPLASQISIVGDGTNITTASATGSRELKINLSNKPVFEEVKTVAKDADGNPITGKNTVMNGNGIFVTSTGHDQVSLTENGLNNGRNVLSNIGRGVADSDAVTLRQLKEHDVKVTGVGSNIRVDAVAVTDEQGYLSGTDYRISFIDSDTTYSANGTNISLGSGNVFSVRYDSNTLTTNSNGLSINPHMVLGSQQLTIDGDLGRVGGLTNTLWYDRPADSPYVQKQAATEGQLKDVVDHGFVLRGNTNETRIPLNTAAVIKGTGNITTEVATTGAEAGNMIIKITEDPVFDDVTASTVTAGDMSLSAPKNFWSSNTYIQNIPGIATGDRSSTYLPAISTFNGSAKVATEGQLYNAVVNMDKADRYVTSASVNDRTVTLYQNNAPSVSFVIPTTSGGSGGTNIVDIGADPFPDGTITETNTNNWYVTKNGVTFYNTTLAATAGETAKINADGEVITVGSYNTAVTGTAEVEPAASSATAKTYGQVYHVMDTAGNEVVISDLASAEVLKAVDGNVINHENRVTALERGITLVAGTANEQTGHLYAGDTLKFVANENTTVVNKGNLSIGYVTDNDGQIDKIDISLKDNPYFTTVSAGGNGATDPKTTIGSEGVFYKDAYYIGASGLYANNKKITGVATGTEATDAVNYGQFAPVEAAVTEGFTVNGHQVSLIGSGSEGFTIASGTQHVLKAANGNESNITIASNGATINVNTVMDPRFDSVKVGQGNTTIYINEENSGYIDNLQNRTWVVNETIAQPGRAATENQLQAIDLGLTQLGMNFVGDIEGSVIHKNLGETLKIEGGATDYSQEDNIGVEYVLNEGDPYLKLHLAKNVNLTPNGSVTIGNITLNQNGLTTVNGQNLGKDTQTTVYNNDGMSITRPGENAPSIVINDDAIKAGDLQINNVGSGLGLNQYVDDSVKNTNAATVGDVKALATAIENGKNTNVTSTTDSNGKVTYKVNLNDNVTLGSGNNQININGTNGTATIGGGNNKVTINGVAGTVTGLTNTTWTGSTNTPNRAATEGQLQNIVDKTNANGGWGLTADSGNAVKQDIGKTLAVTGGTVNNNKNIETKTTANGVEINLKNVIELANSSNTDMVTLNGNTGEIIAGSGNEYKVSINGGTGVITAGQKVTLNGNAGTGSVGAVQIDGTAGSATVSGLSNIAWTPDTVDYSESTKAATEAQLKAMSDAATDYQLVANPDGGNYKANADGEVTLKVKDNKHPNATLQNVIIEDVASKAKLDAVEKDYVKNVSYETTGEGEQATENKNKIVIKQVVNGVAKEVTFENTNDYVVAGTYEVGEDGTVTLARKDVNGNDLDGVVITGIASSADLDNASLSYTTNTDEAKSINLKTGVLTFVDGSNTEAKTNDDGSVTFDLATNIDLGEDGSITIGGTEIKDESVTVGDTTITGDQIQVGGQGGTTITDDSVNVGDITIDGAKDEITIGDTTIKDGEISVGDTTITGDTISTTNIKLGDSETLVTIKQGDKDLSGQTINRIWYGDRQVATMGDGLKFSADEGSDVSKKLNETLPINGDKNITTKTTTAGGIQVTLNKEIDLGDKGSITIGGTEIKDESVTVGDTTITGDSITTDEVNVGDTTINEDGVTTNNITVEGEKGNTVIDGDKITLGDTIITGDSVTTNSLIIGGNTLTIGDSKEEIVYGGTIQRIKYVDAQGITHEVATMDDGLKFTADDKNVINRKHNETLGVIGDGSVVTSADPESGNITVGLADKITVGSGDNKVEIDGENGTITTGGVSIDGANKEITVGDNTTIEDGKVTVGDVTINGDTNTINNLSNTEWKGKADDKSQAATEGQLEDAISQITEKGLDFAGDAGDNTHRALGDTLTIKGGATNPDDLTDGNIGVVSNGKDTLEIKLNKDIDLGKDGSITIGDTSIKDGEIKIGDLTLNEDGLTVGDTSIKDGEITVGENTKIEDNKVTVGDVVIDGEKAEVNVGDKTTIGDGNATIGGVTIDGEGNKVTVGENTTIEDGKVTVGDNTTIEDGKVTVGDVTVNGDTNTINNLSNTEWKGKADDPSQAATEGQLEDAIGQITESGMNFAGDSGDDVHRDLGATLNIVGGADPSALTEGNIGVVADGKDTLTIKLNKDINVDTLAADSKVTVGDNVELNADGSATIGKVEISKDGDIDNGKIQLNADGSASIADGNFNIAANGDIDSKYDGGTIKADGNGFEVKHGDSSLKVDEAGTTISNGDSSTVINGDTINAGDNITINGGDGVVSITGADGAKADITVAKGDNNLAGDEQTRITYGDSQVATLADGMKYTDDNGVVLKRKLNENLNVLGGASELTEGNIGVVATGEDTLNIKLAKKLSGLEEIKVGDNTTIKDGEITVGDTVIDKTSVTTETVNAKDVNADRVTVKETVKVGDKTEITGDTVTTETVKTGDTTINNNGMTIKDGPTVNKDKVDVAGNKIENVAPGILSKDSMDAVNGSQLYQTNQTINKLGNRVNRVGARSAALAALHPMDFDPDDKLTFAAGYGNYKGENAAAIGAFYRPDEKVMFSLAGTVSNDDNMINAGVSFSLDRTPHQTNSKTAMARDILDLTAKVNLLLQENDRMKNALREATKNGGRVSIEFPDLPKDHWAYMYVQELAELGYLIGYPDGMYKGDRTLTRYEFATALYRALMNGAPVDDKMGRGMDEFKNELDNVAKAARFRVDRIAGQDDDRNKIERVRTNHESDENIPDYRDVYGSKIAPPAKK